jgi:hypothetical protein
VYVAAFAVFLAILREQIDVFHRLEAGSGYPAASMAGIFIGWCALLALYYRRRLRRALLFHVLTPTINVLLGRTVSTNPPPWDDLFWLVSSGCWVAVMASFPVAVLELAGRAVDSDRSPRAYLAYCVLLGMIAATILALPTYLLFWRMDHALLYGSLLGALLGARRALSRPSVAQHLGLSTINTGRPLMGAVLGIGLGPFVVVIVNRTWALGVHTLFGAPIPPSIGMLLGIPLVLLGLVLSMLERRLQMPTLDGEPAATKVDS